jgi:NAD(P)-dependent dehydrogenase (short-subunit alcohol dehydrogenase family)
MTQRVLITAGATGIGAEFARAFAATGAKVFTCDIDAAALDALRDEIPGLLTSVCDMASRAQIERTVPQAIKTLGGLDVLINNAGIAGPTAPTDAMPPDEWDKVLTVNITGMFDVTRLAIPALKQSEAGVIINMSSIAGRLGFINRSPYAASKWAVIGFTKTLALELGGNGIRANAILPGAVAGDRIERVFAGRARIANKSLDDVRADAMANQSIKQMVDPKDIAQLAVYLASPAAKAISGQAIPIDNDRQKS